MLSRNIDPCAGISTATTRHTVHPAAWHVRPPPPLHGTPSLPFPNIIQVFPTAPHRARRRTRTSSRWLAPTPRSACTTGGSCPQAGGSAAAPRPPSWRWRRRTCRWRRRRRGTAARTPPMWPFQTGATRWELGGWSLRGRKSARARGESKMGKRAASLARLMRENRKPRAPIMR